MIGARLRCLMASTVLAIAAADATGAIIPVTTTRQKISTSGGCSLQEAIYSANLDNNVAIVTWRGSTPVEVVTQCVPGSGDDIIVLPIVPAASARFSLSTIVDDAYNPTGPTATPIITSNITILAYGATLEHIGTRNFRLFAVGSTGHLTLRRAYIRGFVARGGDGGSGGGGGMGAGGAVYVKGGTLVVEASTFEGNNASGGAGGSGYGGGGGGMGGRGGSEEDCDAGGIGGISKGGGGGGGARGDGAPCVGDYGGGGGGTVSAASRIDVNGGFDCGGDGGAWNIIGGDGDNGRCPGGGGGGGGSEPFTGISGNDGGSGHYGGGGGGGAWTGGGAGARGGFGGGGGASGSTLVRAGDAGDGGFGGGGGAAESGVVFDGNRGAGGFFAGNGTRSGIGGGGGGAGLGGAIFNDGGTIDIRNSTFTNGVAAGGFSAEGQDGIGGGGAIFSRNGSLTVLNSTISGNLAGLGGGIIVAQDSASAPTSFVLQNTIVAGNGPYECAISGFSLGGAFAGNLIGSNTPDGTQRHRETFAGCQGIATTGDPQLGPLQYNQGATPTMAIGSASPARSLADPTTSLPVDQRRQPRPANGGYDIGAFELCLEGFGKLQQPCVILTGAEDPGGSDETVPLTMQVNHPAPFAGTTIPAVGIHDIAKDTVVAVSATPGQGFRFVGWSPNVTNPGDPSTTVVMSAPQTARATFAQCTCASDVTRAIGITYGTVTETTPQHFEQTVTLTNNSAATITGPISLVLDNLEPNATVEGASGETLLMLPAQSPYVSINTNLAPGQSVAVQPRFTNAVDDVVTYSARVLAGFGSR